MVAKIIIGKHIGGILAYNERKVDKGKAELLTAVNFTADSSHLSLKHKLSHFEAFCEKNRRTKTNAVHISLNFDRNDNLDKESLKELSQKYMAAIGFDEQPYLLYRHYDAAHPHVHIVTTNIQSNGERIDLHNIGRNKSEPARKQLEREYGLVAAESKSKSEIPHISNIDLSRALYGRDETKQAISNTVRSITRNWKFTSLAELNAILNQYNVTADPGKENSTLHQKKGLIYRLLDSKGNKIGAPIKASSIYGKPTLKFLEKRYVLNEELRKPYKLQLKQTIDMALQQGLTKDDFSRALSRKAVQVVFRANSEGLIYGITFTDHNSKCVFNGSALGKSYSAKAITETFSNVPNGITKSRGKFETKIDEAFKSASTDSFKGQPSENQFISALFRTEYEEPINNHLEGKRRKKKRRIHL